MIVRLYAVLDSASGVYDGPVPAHNDAVAMRNFTHMARNPDSPIGKNPSDYSLWNVGTYNDSNAEIVTEGKQCLCYAVDLLTPTEEV